MGPNILYEKAFNPITMVEDMEAANKIIVNYIEDYDKIFASVSPFELIAENNLEKFKECIENGLKVNEKDEKGRTFLHIAAASGFVEIVKYLLTLDINIDEQDNHGNTALIVSS